MELQYFETITNQTNYIRSSNYYGFVTDKSFSQRKKKIKFTFHFLVQKELLPFNNQLNIGR